MRPTAYGLVFLLLVASSCVAAQNRQQDTLLLQAALRDSRTAANAGLATLRSLAKQNASSLGFASASDAEAATLGVPFAVFTIRLDSLRAYSSRTDIRQLLGAPDRAIYPVTSGTRAASAIEMSREANRWLAVTFGSPRLVGLLSAARDSLAAASATSQASYFAVRIPALNLYFVGRDLSDNLTLSPLVSDVGGRWRAGAILRARDLLPILAADARAISGLPGD